MTDIHSREYIIENMDYPITLVGMMGSGKSTLGQAIARLLDWPFYDSDRLIEKATGKTIPEIFADDGEQVFREYELSTIKGIVYDADPCVIATGGGSITVRETADVIFNETMSLWINAPLELLVSRTARQKNRPLLQNGNPEEILGTLLAAREGIYKRAAVKVDTDEGPVNIIAERALRQIHEYLLKEDA